MNRRILAAAFSGTLLAAGLATASTASAAPTTCTIVGGEVKTSNIGLPTGLPPYASGTFTITANCLEGGSIAVNTGDGNLTSSACGLSSGTGKLSTGEEFAIQTAGTGVVLTGDVVGTGDVIANPLVADNSCASGTAHSFLLSGVFAKGL